MGGMEYETLVKDSSRAVQSEVELVRRDTECSRNLFARRLAQLLFCFQVRVGWLADAHACSDFKLLQPKVLAPCFRRSCAVDGFPNDFMRDRSTFSAMFGDVFGTMFLARASKAAPCVVLPVRNLAIYMPCFSIPVAQYGMRPD